MTEVFNTGEQAFDQYIMLVLPGAAFALTVAMVVWRRRRRWLWIGGALTLFLFLLTFALPLADHRHMQALAASPAVKTVEGPISGHRRETRRVWLGTSRGVGVGTSSSYRTQTDEQFFIGKQWFAFEVGGFPSTASFTNAGDAPLPLRDGTWARASYIADPWYQNQLRIVKLALGEPAPGETEKGIKDTGFATFWRDFAAAVARGDQAAVQAKTRFPFLFAGTPLQPDRFATVWQALFTPPPLKQCLSRATPLPDGDAWSVSCGVYVYVFEKAGNGWRFATFAADPEAE